MALKKSYKTVKVEKDNGITWVTLNRPEKRNAMSPQLCFDMVDVLTEINIDTDTKVMVLTGAGKAWTAGMDLKEFFRDLDDKPAQRALAREADRRWNWLKLSTLSKPTIAMVNGYCFGGGFIPLAACDFAIAADDAVFGLSEVNWGILPGGLVSKVITDMMTYRQALYYACTGDTFTGKEAAQLGVVTKSVPASKLRAETIKLAENLMQKGPAVVRATKEAVRMCRTLSYEQAGEYLEVKSEQLRFRDEEATRARGMQGFLDDKTYRPGFEPVSRGESKGKKAPARKASTAKKAAAKKSTARKSTARRTTRKKK